MQAAYERRKSLRAPNAGLSRDVTRPPASFAGVHHEFPEQPAARAASAALRWIRAHRLQCEWICLTAHHRESGMPCLAY